MKQNEIFPYRRGIGIGGWLTNYKRFVALPEKWKMPLTIGDYEHFESYITEQDVANIASLGVDHIRVGFDQIVLEEEPYRYRERTFLLLDRFIGWCRKYGLVCILNLHKAVGNYCDVPSPIQLLDDEQLQERFIMFWKACERRWHDQNDLIFELLNEVKNVDPAKWNALLSRTIAGLREMNRERRLIIGGTCWNAPGELRHLQVFDDPGIIYTFHMYAPFEFTHQRGVFQPGPLYYNRVMYYPGDIEPYRDYRRFVLGEENPLPEYAEMNKEVLREMMAGALQFRKDHPEKVLWLGEFGTIRHAPPESRENWMRDVISIAEEAGISYCVWNYLSTPNDGNRFSLVDDDTRKFLLPGLASILKHGINN